MTALAVALICIATCIVDAHPGAALFMGFLGYALGVAGQRRNRR